MNAGTTSTRAPRRGKALTLALVAWVLTWALNGCTGDAPLPGDPLRLATNALPDGVVGEAYRVDVVAVGGLRPYDIRIREGRLPPGIALQDGVLVGNPTTLGSFDVTLEATDGNLAATYADYTITIRDVPIPVLRIDVPDTEVRGDTVLRGRLESARDLQGIRVRVRWENPRLSLTEENVERSWRDAVMFTDVSDGRLALDLARLGASFTGDGEAFRFTFTASEATRIGFDLDVEFLYADRHTFVTRRVGATVEEIADEQPDPEEDTDEASEVSEATGTENEEAP